MKLIIMGETEYLLSRPAVARNQLHLGPYYGHQEVIYRDLLNLRELHFDFEIPEHSYVDVLFQRMDAEFQGLRLSRSEQYPSFVFVSNKDGKFLSKQILDWPLINPGWHRAVIKVGEGHSVVRIDQNEYTIPLRITEGNFSFRGGFGGASIKNIKLFTPDGKREISFVNDKLWFPAVLLALVILMVLGHLFISFRSWPAKKALSAWALLSLVGVETVGAWFVFDYFYYSSQIVSNAGLNSLLLPKHYAYPCVDFESCRFRVTYFLNGLIGGEKISLKEIQNKGYPSARHNQQALYCSSLNEECEIIRNRKTRGLSAVKAPSYRIMMVGSSQTMGAGASNIQSTFFALTHQKLKALLPGVVLESVNLSAAGTVSTDRLLVYKQHYLNFQPDVVVINLSNNDISAELFRQNISEFLTLNKAAGIKTILLMEANNQERQGILGVTYQHRVLSELSKEFQVPVYSHHEFFGRPEVYSSGFIWWDGVHFTDYGHQLMAEWLSPKVYQILVSAKPKLRNHYVRSAK